MLSKGRNNIHASVKGQQTPNQHNDDDMNFTVLMDDKQEKKLMEMSFISHNESFH